MDTHCSEELKKGRTARATELFRGIHRLDFLLFCSMDDLIWMQLRISVQMWLKLQVRVSRMETIHWTWKTDWTFSEPVESQASDLWVNQKQMVTVVYYMVKKKKWKSCLLSSCCFLPATWSTIKWNERSHPPSYTVWPKDCGHLNMWFFSKLLSKSEARSCTERLYIL